MTHTTRFKFNVNDIVTIASDYKEFAKLDIAQPQIQVYSVMSVNADGTITLAGVFSDIPANYVVGVPIESELAKQIYYDTNHARPYEIGKVHLQEDIYSRPPFTATMEERLRNTPIWKKCKQKNSGYSRICVNQFWGMRRPIEI